MFLTLSATAGRGKKTLVNLKLWRKYAIRELLHPALEPMGKVRNMLLGPTAEWKMETDGSPVSCLGRGIGRKELQRLAAALRGPLPN